MSNTGGREFALRSQLTSSLGCLTIKRSSRSIDLLQYNKWVVWLFRIMWVVYTLLSGGIFKLKELSPWKQLFSNKEIFCICSSWFRVMSISTHLKDFALAKNILDPSIFFLDSVNLGLNLLKRIIWEPPLFEPVACCHGIIREIANTGFYYLMVELYPCRSQE